MTRGRLALLVLGPALVLVAGHCAACRVKARPDGSSRGRLDARAAVVGRRVGEFLDEAVAAARSARDHAGGDERLELSPLLTDRLEGAGVLHGGRFASWTGTPAEPALFGDPGSARVLTRGMRTSLLVRSEMDASGRSGVASLVLQIRSGPNAQVDLLPEDRNGIAAGWDFTSANLGAKARFDAGPPATLTWPWLSANSAPLAALVFEEPPPSALAARIRAVSNAWAALVFAVLIAFAVARRAAPVDLRRLAAIGSAVIVARAALACGRTIEELLPRALGSPSLYGRGDVFGLLSSPAALLTTALGAYLLLTAISRTAAVTAARHRLAKLSLWAGVALGGTAAVVALADSLTRDARVRVPRLDPTAPGTLMLALSAAFLIGGVAEVIATLCVSLRSSRPQSLRPARLAVAAAVVPLSVLFLVQSYRISERMTDDRLRSDFAPIVVEQTARRQAALIAAVSDSAAAPRAAAALARAKNADDAFLAYDLWTGSDLSHEGFASSLDLYDVDGLRRGHFGFALPQVGGDREMAARQTTPGLSAVVELETVPAGASLLRVIHAEAAIGTASGAYAGRVVGHVLEDPSNLPFLPGNAAFLDALGGRGSPHEDPSADAPDYVLYDEDGRVVLSTVHQPPVASAAVKAAAASGRRVDVSSGDTRYHALPLSDGLRLHLLLVPAPTMLGALADGVRLLLLALAVLAIAAFADTVAGGEGLEPFRDMVRGSFYRKLLATVLIASIVPLIGLAFFLRAYIDRRGEASLTDAAAALVGAAGRVVEDYQTVGEDDPTVPRLRVTDEALWWLRRVVGQEIHVYEDGVLAATSKPELFDSALLAPRLPGDVDRDVVRGGRSFVVRRERLGALTLPVAYARLDEPGGPRDAVIAVPLLLEQRAFQRSVDRLVEMLLLLTAALVTLLAVSAAWIARSVAQPVRRMADASRRIAEGDYRARLFPSSRDEMGSLVADFNRMAAALAAQRADIERRRDYIEALLRHATTGVVSTDAAGRVVTINPAASSLLARAGDPPAAGDLLVATLARSEALRPLAAALSGPRAESALPVEVDSVGDGEISRFRLVRIPLPIPDGSQQGSLILLDDVTSLMKSNQLAAWAEMARAIAHEIKNPLTPIQLSAEHVRKLLRDRGVAPVPEIEACLDTIARNVLELRDISSAFSTYAKIPDLDLQRVDPGTLLRDIVAPYRAAPPASVTIVENHAAAPRILADPRVLARAIVNLIENALQAMPDGGTLAITSGPGDPGEVTLAVSDTGSGLTQEARARLFEPYFSTKSSGTGLGLAIVRRVVAGHGGSIDVTSAPGQGTSFRIRLKEAPVS